MGGVLGILRRAVSTVRSAAGRTAQNIRVARRPLSDEALFIAKRRHTYEELLNKRHLSDEDKLSMIFHH